MFASWEMKTHHFVERGHRTISCCCCCYCFSSVACFLKKPETLQVQHYLCLQTWKYLTLIIWYGDEFTLPFQESTNMLEPDGTRLKGLDGSFWAAVWVVDYLIYHRKVFQGRSRSSCTSQPNEIMDKHISTDGLPEELFSFVRNVRPVA